MVHKKIIASIVLSFCCLLTMVFMSCTDDNDVIETQPQACRTVLAYLVVANGNNLNNYLQDNIIDMYRGLEQMENSCTLLIYWDGTESGSFWPTPRILQYTTDGLGNVNGTYGLTSDTEILQAAVTVIEYPIQDSTDPEIMIGILNDMASIAQDSHYGLIMGSHGSGWLKYIDGRKTLSIGQDNDGDNTIEIPQLAQILSQSNLGQLDFLLFDACYMGNVETLYELRNNTHYCIASPTEILLGGFPYDKMLSLLYSSSVTDYTTRACEVFIEDNANKWATIAAYDCTAIDQLATAFYQQLTTHSANIPYVSNASLQQYGRGTFRYFSMDMIDFISLLNDGEIPVGFQTAFDNVVIYTGITTPCVISDSSGTLVVDPDHYSGMGTYIPKGNNNAWNSYFQESISWYSAAGWDQVGY